ncbi:MAG: AraC family ligand binding domain-containing protein [Acidobacteriota bacterium]|nr:AraC family ligand binding domain-containing protein [Acidobacteriota bacterium]
MRTITIFLLGAITLVPSMAQPTCNQCPATYVSSDELQAYLKRVEGTAVSDQQVRALDVGKTNVDIAVVYRGKLAAPAKQSVAVHDKVSEVYHVIDGSATLMTGPDIVDLKPRPADDRAVRLLNGPGGNGASIRNGVAYQLKAGDVIVIPAGTGHLFTRIDDHIRYLMIRLDPDKVAPLKDEAASKADLATGGKNN